LKNDQKYLSLVGLVSNVKVLQKTIAKTQHLKKHLKKIFAT